MKHKYGSGMRGVKVAHVPHTLPQPAGPMTSCAYFPMDLQQARGAQLGRRMLLTRYRLIARRTIVRQVWG